MGKAKDGTTNDAGEPYCTNPGHGLIPMEWNPEWGQWECGSCCCTDRVSDAPDGKPPPTFDESKRVELARWRRRVGDDPQPGDDEAIAAWDARMKAMRPAPAPGACDPCWSATGPRRERSAQ